MLLGCYIYVYFILIKIVFFPFRPFDLCFCRRCICMEKMQCTPQSNIYLQNCKGQQSYDCSDSGYSGLFHSPQSISGADSCKSVSLEECSETSKENLRPSVTPKEETTEPLKVLGHRGMQQTSGFSWCETPRRDSSLRQRRLMCRPDQPVKSDNIRSPCSKGSEAPLGWLSLSFDSIDSGTGNLKSEQDLPLSCRKRRLLFTQTRTSTLEDGKLNSDQLSSFGRRISLSDAEVSENENLSASDLHGTPVFNKILLGSSKESSRSPIGSVSKSLYDDSSVLCTPSSTHTPNFIRYLFFRCFWHSGNLNVYLHLFVNTPVMSCW